jgi:hypothetical protein
MVFMQHRKVAHRRLSDTFTISAGDDVAQGQPDQGEERDHLALRELPAETARPKD